MTKKKTIRPEGYSDLDLIWAIRDIPSSILCIKLKSVLYSFVSIIGNSPNEWYYKSLIDLGEIIGISARRLQDLLHELEDLGFIYIKRPQKYNRGLTNEYKLNYELILSTGNKGMVANGRVTKRPS